MSVRSVLVWLLPSPTLIVGFIFGRIWERRHAGRAAESAKSRKAQNPR